MKPKTTPGAKDRPRVVPHTAAASTTGVWVVRGARARVGFNTRAKEKKGNKKKREKKKKKRGKRKRGKKRIEGPAQS